MNKVVFELIKNDIKSIEDKVLGDNGMKNKILEQNKLIELLCECIRFEQEKNKKIEKIINEYENKIDNYFKNGLYTSGYVTRQYCNDIALIIDDLRRVIK